MTTVGPASVPAWVDRAILVAIRVVLVPAMVCAAIIYAVKGYAGLAAVCLVVLLAFLGMQAIFRRSLRRRSLPQS